MYKYSTLADQFGVKHFHSKSHSPASKGLAFIETAGAGREVAVCEAGSAEQQDIVHRIADAAAQCAKPGIGKFPWSERVVSCAGLNISFCAEHPLSGLPVEA